ncbi:MAG: GNAT family N-acetyltransferase [Fretibacterium sp.]|nr:GNAT family N-acetyltransferase [Fretibacterium sp.]
MNAELWENLGFFLTRLRGLPSCESLTLPGGFCLSTGSESASENWAFSPGVPPDEKWAGRMLNFFDERGVPFVCPVEEDNTPRALTAAGLRERGRLAVMTRNPEGLPEGAPDVTFHPVSSPEDTRRWAQAAWRGFDGEVPAPEAFQKLAGNMAGDTLGLRLVLAEIQGREAGTFLLALSREAAGIYYFATVPEFRRRGVASAMMAKAGCMALTVGCPELVLQSTPAGLPFYRSEGFTLRGELALFSSSEDVF